MIFYMNNIYKKRVAIYIDGSNFYFSVKKAFNCKVDIEQFCKKLIGNNELVKISYYIAPIEQFSDPNMYAEQQKFFDRLKKVYMLNIIFGRLEKRKRDGRVYYVEKATDVNLALDLVLDAQKDFYDKAFLISNDGDFSSAVLAAKNFGKEVIYVAMGNKNSISHHLRRVASQIFYITKGFILDCKA